MIEHKVLRFIQSLETQRKTKNRQKKSKLIKNMNGKKKKQICMLEDARRRNSYACLQDRVVVRDHIVDDGRTVA